MATVAYRPDDDRAATRQSNTSDPDEAEEEEGAKVTNHDAPELLDMNSWPYALGASMYCPVPLTARL